MTEYLPVFIFGIGKIKESHPESNATCLSCALWNCKRYSIYLKRYGMSLIHGASMMKEMLSDLNALEGVNDDPADTETVKYRRFTRTDRPYDE